MSVPAQPPEVSHTSQRVAPEVTSAPWHEAHLVTDYDRAHGYVPCEEMDEKGYAQMVAWFDSGRPIPKKMTRGAWPGPAGASMRVRRIYWLAREQGGVFCRYCHTTMAPNAIAVIRLVPPSRGGRVEKGNLGLACSPCASSKGSRTDDEHRAAIAGGVA